jgi:hypothetical protein
MSQQRDVEVGQGAVRVSERRSVISAGPSRGSLAPSCSR